MRKRLLTPLKPLLELLSAAECRVARAWVARAYRRRLGIQWGLPPAPAFFDHDIDLYHQFLHTRSPHWCERGICNGLALAQDGALLELCCGDGFNTRNFYSLRCRSVVACDFDPAALALARRRNAHANITYVLADIRTAMPAGSFDNVIWDAAIEPFTPAEVGGILANIKQRLKPAGILGGSTIVETPGDVMAIHRHGHSIRGAADLLAVLAPHFRHCTVFSSRIPASPTAPARHNLYFWAADAAIPFADGWPGTVRTPADAR
jgi:SAM-dependent methyltransferase